MDKGIEFELDRGVVEYVQREGYSEAICSLGYARIR
jgi:hypothetical protein